mmetsp:Transcript_34248/g.82875  ORF Transcript_34248/g.82875 Transcript_34248/m.82875 type:complete len:295 (-) Transcript_34248:968-1852(-)
MCPLHPRIGVHRVLPSGVRRGEGARGASVQGRCTRPVRDEPAVRLHQRRAPLQGVPQGPVHRDVFGARHDRVRHRRVHPRRAPQPPNGLDWVCDDEPPDGVLRPPSSGEVRGEAEDGPEVLHGFDLVRPGRGDDCDPAVPGDGGPHHPELRHEIRLRRVRPAGDAAALPGRREPAPGEADGERPVRRAREEHDAARQAVFLPLPLHGLRGHRPHDPRGVPELRHALRSGADCIGAAGHRVPALHPADDRQSGHLLPVRVHLQSEQLRSGVLLLHRHRGPVPGGAALLRDVLPHD